MRCICLAVVLAALLALLDVWTTAWLLACGATEGNPAAAWLLARGGLLAFAAGKAVIVAMFAGELRAVTGARRRLLLAAVVCFVLALPVVWNLHDLLLLH